MAITGELRRGSLLDLRALGVIRLKRSDISFRCISYEFEIRTLFSPSCCFSVCVFQLCPPGQIVA